MEIATIPFEVNRYRKRPMPCFIWGCKNQAEHLTKFNYGDAVVQVCLCDNCLNKSPEFILKGLRAQPENVVN
jgi:hypothetical protein